MKEKLLSLLEDIRPDVEFEKEEKLIDDGVLDSLDIVSIMEGLENKFGIKIDIEDLEPENFNSAEAMINLIRKLQG